jgi:hypothetical protein
MPEGSIQDRQYSIIKSMQDSLEDCLSTETQIGASVSRGDRWGSDLEIDDRMTRVALSRVENNPALLFQGRLLTAGQLSVQPRNMSALYMSAP